MKWWQVTTSGIISAVAIHWLTVGTPILFTTPDEPALIHYTTWQSQLDERLLRDDINREGGQIATNFALLRLRAEDPKGIRLVELKIRLSGDVDRAASYVGGSMYSDDGRTLMISDREYEIGIERLPSDGYYQVAFVGEKGLAITDVTAISPDVQLRDTEEPVESYRFVDVLLMAGALLGLAAFIYTILSFVRKMNISRKKNGK